MEGVAATCPTFEYPGLTSPRTSCKALIGRGVKVGDFPTNECPQDALLPALAITTICLRWRRLPRLPTLSWLRVKAVPIGFVELGINPS